MFRLLAQQSGVGSLQLAEALGVASPRGLAGALTTALKRRAASLGLEVPWRTDADADGRTVWHDRDGIAARMQAALSSELARRGPERAAS
jgi:hypothetical protein